MHIDGEVKIGYQPLRRGVLHVALSFASLGHSVNQRNLPISEMGTMASTSKNILRFSYLSSSQKPLCSASLEKKHCSYLDTYRRSKQFLHY